MSSTPPDLTLDRLNSMMPDGFVAALADIVGHGARVAGKGLYNTVFMLHTAPIRYFIAEPESHDHVPPLTGPWNDTTYRGS